MNRALVDRILKSICLLMLLMPAAWAADSAILPGLDQALVDAQAVERLDELEPVLIVGGVATPKIWKVSKDGHVMWVLGRQALPAGARWRLDEVEARVAESQLVLYPGAATLDIDVGFFRIISLVPTAYRTAKNPDGKKLKDVLPAEVYARWRDIKTRYAGRDNDIEEWRPAVALAFLMGKVEDKLKAANPGLPPPPPPPPPPVAQPVFGPLIEKTAKKHKVKIRTLRKVEREVKIRNVRDMLKSVRVPTDLEVGCFTEGLDYLERRIEFENQRASGAVPVDARPPSADLCGDMADKLVKGMRSGEIPDPAGIVKVIDNLALQDQLAREQRDAEWIDAARAAIAKNRATFTLLGMNQIIAPTGYIAKLRELGYTIEEPE